MRDEVKRVVRERVGGIASLSVVAVVEKLPKTRSGKILRRTIRDFTVKPRHEVPVPSTIEDTTALDVIFDALKDHGLQA